MHKCESFPELSVTVHNSGDDTLNAAIKAERIVGQTTETFGLRTAALLPNQPTVVKFPGLLGKDTVQFRISVDVNNEITELSETNNILTGTLVINTFAVLPGIGSTYDGITSDTIRIAGLFKVAVARPRDDSSVVILRSIAPCQFPDSPNSAWFPRHLNIEPLVCRPPGAIRPILLIFRCFSASI
jgi:hypothetical protein